MFDVGTDNGQIARLIPQFPSYTFPNHYSMVTGMLPASHGIIGNDFYDAEMASEFSCRRDALGESDKKWWLAEPVSFIFKSSSQGKSSLHHDLWITDVENISI